MLAAYSSPGITLEGGALWCVVLLFLSAITLVSRITYLEGQKRDARLSFALLLLSLLAFVYIVYSH